MANPTGADLHVDVPLTSISVAYRQSADRFIADKVFPTIPVNFRSDLYWEFKRDAFFRSDVEERAPAAPSSGTDFNIVKSGPYYARVYAVHYDIPDITRANADPNTNLDFASTELVTQQQLLKRDSLWLANYFATSIWTTDVTGVTSAASVDSTHFLRWDLAGATPREDVRNAALSIESKTGFYPNTLVLNPNVLNAIINAPEFLDSVKYGPRAGIIAPTDLDLVAQFFGVDRVLRASAVQNTATEGATLSTSFMFGKHALLCYAAPNPGMMTPSAGYTFAWNGYLGGTSDIVIKKWHDMDRAADRVESEMAFDMRLIGADLGYFFSTAVS